MSRIERRFQDLKQQGRAGLVTFITAGDPDQVTGQKLLNALPGAGADFIELGMPFSDPMADGPAIQASSLRALTSGMTLEAVLRMVQDFRVTDAATPLILMGYYNPIYTYGTQRFVEKASKSGVDGLIIVDLPPEEDEELYAPSRKTGLDIIRLVTPTTNAARLDTILKRASGFIYYVSITGITGTAQADSASLKPHLDALRARTDLPVAVGFGITSPADVAAMAQVADAVVVGSALVRGIAEHRDEKLLAAQVRSLADAL